MATKDDNATRIAVLAGICLAVAGCATDSRDKWLRVFFDGVPPRVTADASATPGSEPAATEVAAGDGVVLPVASPPRGVLHPPFDDRQCDACHESKYSQGLNGTMLEVCFSCHDDFLADTSHKHAPAEEGECTECHNPHRSAEPHLLVRSGADLCYECHDDTVSEAKYKHAPAEEGECTECHDPHAANQEYLLATQVPALCFECHDAEDVTAADGHKDMGEASCTTCHDPHGSDRERLLKRDGTAGNLPARQHRPSEQPPESET